MPDEVTPQDKPRNVPADFPLALHQARAVVSDPVANPASPGALLMAWAMLKGARGQQVNQLVLRKMLRSAGEPLPPLPLAAFCPNAAAQFDPQPRGAA